MENTLINKVRRLTVRQAPPSVVTTWRNCYDFIAATETTEVVTTWRNCYDFIVATETTEVVTTWRNGVGFSPVVKAA